MVAGKIHVYRAILHMLKNRAKTSISGSNLEMHVFHVFQKREKTQKSHFLRIFGVKSAILFVKIRLIIHFWSFRLLQGGLVFSFKKSKFQLLIEVFARFFRVPMRGWFFDVFLKT